MNRRRWAVLAALLATAPAAAQAPDPLALARAYGGREAAFGVRLSPGLDRQLESTTARVDLLAKSTAWITAAPAPLKDLS